VSRGRASPVQQLFGNRRRLLTPETQAGLRIRSLSTVQK
jgi:hypothetical protein